jgi:hypothetical protein
MGHEFLTQTSIVIARYTSCTNEDLNGLGEVASASLQSRETDKPTEYGSERGF